MKNPINKLIFFLEKKKMARESTLFGKSTSDISLTGDMQTKRKELKSTCAWNFVYVNE